MSKEENFFAEIPQPRDYELHKQRIADFVSKHSDKQKTVVLVTSGGTTVPLERNTVRYIDNFSAGTRGSASAEHFLAASADVAVIFLHRLTSLRPYTRHFTHTNFLDLVQEDDNGEVKVKQGDLNAVRGHLRAYEAVRTSGRLLEVPFTSLSDYLWLLHAACQNLSTLGDRAVLYLAAAVSDFYIPSSCLSEHKLQSGEGAPDLQLKLVPKMLKPLVKEWIPEAFVISFKLETDPAILRAKARKALETYCHELVVANILGSRKTEVVLVTLEEEVEVRLSEEEVGRGDEIEAKIIEAVLQRHQTFVKSK